ncbi:hypothetical protein NPIL_364181 [Nephila pilipes]|uniref:Uncharacterized protein n=1 Tax=Nephila pilipes TaxID=299642 RepID=A0A8X6PQF6_NEPPI|nr:hypothetical protein NPIL_364181 [Nephila pilipes]
MFRTLGSVIQDSFFVPGKHLIEYGCGAVSRRQRHTGYNLLSLENFQQRVRNPLAQPVFLTQEVQRKSISSETLNCFASSPHVELLSSSMTICRASSSKACGRPLQGSSKGGKPPDLNFETNALRYVHSHYYPQALDIFGDLMQLLVIPL